MFKKIKDLIEQEKELSKAMNKAAKENKSLQNQSIQLLSKIEAAEKRGGVLLLSDMNEELIKKLQSITDDNTVIIFLANDNTRIEIRRDGSKYKRNDGTIR